MPRRITTKDIKIRVFVLMDFSSASISSGMTSESGIFSLIKESEPSEYSDVVSDIESFISIRKTCKIIDAAIIGIVTKYIILLSMIE